MWRILLLLGLLASPALAQPVLTPWRPPVGCTNGQAIVYNGTAWVCGTAGVGGSGTTNALTKWTSSSAIGNSSCTDDGAVFACNPSSTFVLSANSVERIEAASGSTRYVGIGHMGSTSPISQLDIYDSNAGQTTSALTDAGSRAGMIFVQDGGTATDTGGAILFGNGTTHSGNVLGFAGIKGLIQSGAGNGIGDLAISTRNGTSDTALTERMRITAAGAISGNGNWTLGNAATDSHTLNGIANLQQIRGKKQTYTTPTGAQTVTLNDDTSIVEFNATASIDLVGFAGGAADRVILIRNKGTANVLIYNENGSASAADRFDLDTLGFGYVVNGGGMAIAIYDATASRWSAAWMLGKNTPGDITVNGAATVTGNMVWTGGSTQGDASGDVHTVNGGMTVTNGLTVNSSGLTVTASGLTVQGGTAQFDQNVIVGNANSDTLTITAKIDSKVHYTGTAPTISSCGTSPSVVGNDARGTVTMGTGTVTSCTVTFSAGYTTNAPACTLGSQMTARGDLVFSAKSTTAFTMTSVSGANMATGKFDYICDGIL